MFWDRPYTSCADTEIFARVGGGGPGPIYRKKALTTGFFSLLFFFSPQLILLYKSGPMVSFQRKL